MQTLKDDTRKRTLSVSKRLFLRHNIERGQKGRHKKHVKKHEDALAKMEPYIINIKK